MGMRAWGLALALVGAVTATGGSALADGQFLQLDGVKVGALSEADVPYPHADVLASPVGPQYFTKKQIGTPRYGTMTFSFGAEVIPAKSGPAPLYDWIAASWQMNYQRKNGAVILFDDRGAAVTQREFFNALIKSTTIPALDKSKNDPVKIVLKVDPEYLRNTKASGQVTDRNAQTAPPWRTSAFRFDLDRTDTSGIVRVEPLTVTQQSATDPGADRDYLKEPGKLEFPNVVLYVDRAKADDFVRWHEDFVIKGNNDEGKERSGTLRLTGSWRDLAVRFYNAGIFRIADVVEGNSRLLKVYLYVERMELALTVPNGPMPPPATQPVRRVSPRLPIPKI
jgi:hypothetical protein